MKKLNQHISQQTETWIKRYYQIKLKLNVCLKHSQPENLYFSAGSGHMQ